MILLVVFVGCFLLENYDQQFPRCDSSRAHFLSLQWSDPCKCLQGIIDNFQQGIHIYECMYVNIFINTYLYIYICMYMPIYKYFYMHILYIYRVNYEPSLSTGILKGEVRIPRCISLPGNSAGDLFWDGYMSEVLRGCW